MKCKWLGMALPRPARVMAFKNARCFRYREREKNERKKERRTSEECKNRRDRISTDRFTVVAHACNNSDRHSEEINVASVSATNEWVCSEEKKNEVQKRARTHTAPGEQAIGPWNTRRYQLIKQFHQLFQIYGTIDKTMWKEIGGCVSGCFPFRQNYWHTQTSKQIEKNRNDCGAAVFLLQRLTAALFSFVGRANSTKNQTIK